MATKTEPSSTENAFLTAWPSSERVGMFCRLGLELDRRPVAVMVWLYVVCTRPSVSRSAPSVSRYVDLILVRSRYSKMRRTIS